MKEGLFIIAEIAQAHDGSLGILHSYIDAISRTGVNAIKFQTHIAEAESSEYEPFRTKFSYVDKTRYDYWKRMEFTLPQWKEIKMHCDEVGLEFISSPFSIAAIDLLENVGVKRYKVGSGEVSNLLLLEKLARIGKPVILSSGLSNIVELDGAINLLNNFNINVSILQCTTAYPTQPKDWGLNVIQTFKERYNIPVGFSDHSGNIYACLAATAIGAKILEFHAVFDKRMFGPDAKASLEINQISDLVKGAREIYSSLHSEYNKEDNGRFSDLKQIFEKSLAVNKDLQSGYEIKFEDLEAKKPKGYGISAIEYKRVIGEKIKRDIKAFEFLNDADL